MSYNVGTLSATLALDAKNFESALNNAKKSVAGLAREAEQTATSANQSFTSWLSKSEADFKKMSIAGIAGLAALGLGIKSTTAAYFEQEQQIQRLTHITQTSVGASDAQVQGLIEQAAALQNLGVVSDSTIMQGMGTLATFDLQTESIKTLIPAVLDYAVAEKGAAVSSDELRQMTNGLAQAMQGNFASLTKTGFVIDDHTKKMIAEGTEAERVAGVVKVLNSTYEGMNAAMRNTAAGGMQALKNSVTDLKESLGEALIPALNGIVQGALKATDWLKKLSQTNPELIQGFVASAGTAFTLLAALGSIGFVVPKVVAGLKAIGITAAGSVAPWIALAVAVVAAMTIIVKAIGAIGRAKSATIENNAAVANSTKLMEAANKETGAKRENLIRLAHEQTAGTQKTNDMTKATDSLGKAFGGAGEKAKGAGSAARDAASEMQKAIDQQNARYKESLMEMVVQHRDTIIEIRKSIQDELDDFERAQEDKKRSYDRQVSDMEESHNAQMNSLQEQLRKESDVNAQLEENFKDKANSRKQQYDKKVKDFEASLAAELAKSDTYDQRKVDALQESLATEKAEYDLYMATLTAGYEEDVAKNKTAEETKKADIQTRINAELAEYNKRRSRIDEDRAREIARDKEEHTTKLDQLKAKLAEEQAIEKKHADEFALYKDTILADDITKLKQNHAQRLAEIKAQYAKETSSAAGAAGDIAGSFEGMADDIVNAIDKLIGNIDKGVTKQKGFWTKAWDEMKEQWGETVATFKTQLWVFQEAFRLFKGWLGEQWQSIKETATHWWNLVGDTIKATMRIAINFILEKLEGFLNAAGGGLNKIIEAIPGVAAVTGTIPPVKLPRYAQGTENYPGGFGLVGERGAELVQLPQGSKIYDNEKTEKMLNSGGDIVINNPVFNSPLDMRTAIREAFAEREFQGLV